VNTFTVTYDGAQATTAINGVIDPTLTKVYDSPFNTASITYDAPGNIALIFLTDTFFLQLP
jgi:hypothetical protein